MSRLPPHDEPLPIRRARPVAGPAEATLPLPLHHHPVVALSLILMAGCLAQVAAWLVQARLPASGPILPPAGIAHGYLFNALAVHLHRLVPEAQFDPALFVASIALCLLSAGGWYAVARSAIGPAWGLWTALLWVVHPCLAYAAQHPGPLVLQAVLVPFSLALLLRWHQAHTAPAAVGAGLGLGLLALVGWQGVLLAAVALGIVLLSPIRRRRAVTAAVLLVGGCAAPPMLAVTVGQPRFDPAFALRQLSINLRVALDDAPALGVSSTQPAGASPTQTRPGSVVNLYWQTARATPRETAAHLARRAAHAVYATADHRLERPLLAVQLLFLVPAGWGLFVGLRHAPWRGPVMICCLWVLPFWLAATLAEPLVRNLVPAGGVPVLLALVGVADIYERFFGRRLTEPDPELRPVARPRGPGYNPLKVRE